MEKFNKEEIENAKPLINLIYAELRKQHPKIRKVDSNLFHFCLYRLHKKGMINLSFGWFKHGPYCISIDDALVDMKIMDKEQHQLYGNEKIMKKVIECDCHHR